MMKVSSRSGGRLVSTGVALIVVAALIAGAIILQYSMDNAAASRTGWEESSPFDTGRSVLNILGGIRESLAANLWTKTDTIFHEYLGANVGKEDALYPYYWLITRLDPHFTMAYYYASWMLARVGRVEQGFNLALEGLRYNPYSARLQENLASIYFFFKKDPGKARYHILKAIELADDEQEREIYENFLGIIDKVLSGQKTIPDVVPLQHVNKLNQEQEEHEGHEKH